MNVYEVTLESRAKGQALVQHVRALTEDDAVAKVTTTQRAACIGVSLRRACTAEEIAEEESKKPKPVVVPVPEPEPPPPEPTEEQLAAVQFQRDWCELKTLGLLDSVGALPSDNVARVTELQEAVKAALGKYPHFRKLVQA